MKAGQLPIIRKAMPLLKDTPDSIPVNTYHSNNESLPLLSYDTINGHLYQQIDQILKEAMTITSSIPTNTDLILIR